MSAARIASQRQGCSASSKPILRDTGQTIGLGRFDMGMFVDVPPLDERVLTPAAIDFMVAIRDLEALLITPTVARINRKLTGDKVNQQKIKNVPMWYTSLELENAGFIEMVNEGRAADRVVLTQKGWAAIGGKHGWAE